MIQAHEVFIRESIRLAEQAVKNENHPFGAVLVKAGEILMSAENTVITERDVTGHAETNLVRMAVAKYDAAFLEGCILYASTEPCAMCSGAIYWSGIGRVVYSCSQERLYSITGGEGGLPLSCRDVLEKGRRKVIVEGPLMEEEALQVHINYW